MPAESLTAVEIHGLRLLASGLVQGLGVRPAVARLARRFDLRGFVANTSQGLLVEVAGASDEVAEFSRQFRGALPGGVVIEHLHFAAIEPEKYDGFAIRERCDEGAAAATVPLDLVVCEKCLGEIRDAGDRRAGYPFTSCTQCGPRYSIIAAMPYDRPATSMDSFAFCPACAAEYAAEDDRRFHAQTNACPTCGPRVWLVDAAGRQLSGGDAAIEAAARALLAGRIVALKGLGGYQLLVDATSTAAVERLRERKGRRTKPLAVMVRDLNAAEHLARLSEEERRQLASLAGPIVVVRRRADAPLSPVISPELPTVGLMLPTTPLHALLLDRTRRPLVTTSGNREGGVLACDETSAERELTGIADLWLHHDRPIVRPIDDSVLRVIDGRPCVLRLARGLAPLRLPPLAGDHPRIALGGQQKNAIAIWNGSQAVLGPHVGDLDDLAVCSRWQEQLDSLAALYGVSLADAEFVCDAHPDYFTSHYAPAASAWPLTGNGHLRKVFHHHAHIAAVMLEHGLDREVLGLAWDGTGFGEDGTIWGGEALLATRGGFRRVGWLRPFPLPGGEQAIREPWRVAAAFESAVDPAAIVVDRSAINTLDRGAIHDLVRLLAKPHLMPHTSSLGRLFDGVAALALGVTHSHDDGRPAMLLELAADPQTAGSYSLAWDRASGIADWRPLIADVLRDRRQGATPGEIAMRFHRAIADWAADIAAAYPQLPLVLGGGCFQNALLRELLAERLAARPAGVHSPFVLPPGDGGLAAGQLAAV